MKTIATLLILLFSSGLSASTHCHDSERFGQQLIRVGDSERKVLEVAGQPDREIQLENRLGAGVGIRLDYYQRGKTVQIQIQGGVVSRICITRESMASGTLATRLPHPQRGRDGPEVRSVLIDRRAS